MGGKAKKGQNKPADKPILDEANVTKKMEPGKEEELNRIMAGIN